MSVIHPNSLQILRCASEIFLNIWVDSSQYHTAQNYSPSFKENICICIVAEMSLVLPRVLFQNEYTNQCQNFNGGRSLSYKLLHLLLLELIF